MTLIDSALRSDAYDLYNRAVHMVDTDIEIDFALSPAMVEWADTDGYAAIAKVMEMTAEADELLAVDDFDLEIN